MSTTSPAAGTRPVDHVEASDQRPLPTLTTARNLTSPDSLKWPKHRALAALFPTLLKASARQAGNYRRGNPTLRKAFGDSLAGPEAPLLPPTWCEWFMGFPEGWTQFGQLALPLLATPSSPSAPRSSDG